MWVLTLGSFDWGKHCKTNPCENCWPWWPHRCLQTPPAVCEASAGSEKCWYFPYRPECYLFCTSLTECSTGCALPPKPVWDKGIKQWKNKQRQKQLLSCRMFRYFHFSCQWPLVTSLVGVSSHQPCPLTFWMGQFYHCGLMPSVGLWTYKSRCREYNTIVTSQCGCGGFKM